MGKQCMQTTTTTTTTTSTTGEDWRFLHRSTKAKLGDPKSGHGDHGGAPENKKYHARA